MKPDVDHAQHSKAVFTHVMGGCIGCVLTAALYFGVIAPAFANRREVQALSESLVDRASELDAMNQQINNAKEEVESLAAQLGGTVGLRDVSQVNRYVQQVVEIAEQSRCKVSEAKPGEYQSVTADYGYVPVDLKCEGRPEDIIGFLRALHDTHRDTDVVACALSSHSTNSRVIATSTLSLKWYTLPEGTIVAGDSARAVSAVSEASSDHGVQNDRTGSPKNGR